VDEDTNEQEKAYFFILFLVVAMAFIGYARYHDNIERQRCVQDGGYVEEVLDERGRLTEDWTCRREDRD
jgi:hypothetical protein